MKFIKIIKLRLLIFCMLALIFKGNYVMAQSVGIASTAITPDASSILEMRSTARGMLIPRMTTVQRDAINSGSFATGLMIYNTDTNNFNYWNGAAWVVLQRNNSAIAAATNTKISYDANGLVTAGVQAAASDLSNGTTGAGNIVLANSPVLVTPNLGTPSAGVATNLTGTAAGLTAGTVITNANLTGEVTSVGNTTTISSASVIAKVLTGYTSGAGTILPTDNILQAIQKLNGNNATNANLTGMVTSVGNATTVVTNANLTGDVTSVGNAATVSRINGTSLAGLSTGIIKNTTTTGIPTIAVAGTDFVAPNTAITGATNTKITYDAKGLVTAGAAATTADIAASTNRNYVTDAQQTVIANTSGINTGDQTSVSGNAGTATSLATGRTIGITGDVTYTSPSFNGTANITAAATVTRINGTALSGLATGILKNTTTTGVPTIAVPGTDYLTPGALIKFSVITSGTSFTLDGNTTKFVIEIAGAGGGGGGAIKAGGGRLAVASGGGGGGYLKKLITVVSGSPTFSIGTGGTAGSNTGGNGGSGGATRFTYNSVTYTANGGGGGAGDASGGNSISIVSSGTAGTASGGDINLTGVDGAPGLTLSGSVGTSGNGGNSYLGNTSRSLSSSGDGIGGSAFGYGVGGSGAFDNNTSARIGGVGSSGVVIIWEYK